MAQAHMLLMECEQSCYLSFRRNLPEDLEEALKNGNQGLDAGGASQIGG